MELAPRVLHLDHRRRFLHRDRHCNMPTNGRRSTIHGPRWLAGSFRQLRLHLRHLRLDSRPHVGHSVRLRRRLRRRTLCLLRDSCRICLRIWWQDGRCLCLFHMRAGRMCRVTTTTRAGATWSARPSPRRAHVTKTIVFPSVMVRLSDFGLVDWFQRMQKDQNITLGVIPAVVFPNCVGADQVG